MSLLRWKQIAIHIATLGLAVILLASESQATESHSRPGYGLIGYGITMYYPRCAYSCQAAIPKMLDCSDNQHSHDKMNTNTTTITMPSPQCLATNMPYLLSLAWCIETHCDGNISVLPELEKWWVLNVAGRSTHQPSPKISYQEAVEQVKSPPTQVLGNGKIINGTVRVDEAIYETSDKTLAVFEHIETSHSTLSMVVFLTGAASPIALSCIRFLPLPATLHSRLHAAFIDPPVFGIRHSAPFKGLVSVPTRGQALFIFYIVIVNIVASSTGIYISEPNAWYPTSWYQVAVYIANRTGSLSFANIPLVILLSGRNNILLWLTDWSHATFLLLHRYIAWICVIEACIHSGIYLHLYIWKERHAEESALSYWWWGIIGTLSLSLLLPLSIRPIRSAAYEAFRISHILLTVLAIVGSWYHIIYRYAHQWGYETWLYIAISIWGFEHIARLARIASNGIHRADIMPIDDDYVRLNIPKIQATGYIYVYFPTLSWKVWENHPFSVVTSMRSQSPIRPDPRLNKDTGKLKATQKRSGISEILEDSTCPTTNQGNEYASPGITLFVRVHDGLTSKFTSKINMSSSIPVLIESSYGNDSPNLFPGSPITQDIRFPNTIYMVGGVGITAVLPLLTNNLSLHTTTGYTKLFWGSHSVALMKAVEDLIGDVRVDENGTKWWASHIETHQSLQERLDIRGILTRELSSGKKATVIVSAPGAMADDVRQIALGLGRGTAVVKFVQESFTW